MLYSRLTDGRLWLPQEEDVEEARRRGARGRSSRFPCAACCTPCPGCRPLLAWRSSSSASGRPRDAEARLDLWVSRLSFQLAKSATVVERLRLQEIAATQLAALRLPTLPAPAEWKPAGSGGMKGFLLAARPSAGTATQLTLNTLPLPAGTRVVLEHLGADGEDAPNAYRLSFDGSDEELRVTFQGDVVLKPLDAPPALLHLEHPDSLVLYPQSRSLDLDVLFDRFAQRRDRPRNPHRPPRPAPHRRAARPRSTSLVREESTLLGGEVHVRATASAIR